MNLFIAPHNDDETLFGAYTLMREKPLVVIVTDSWRQWNRGEGVSANDRWVETHEAMKILKCPYIRLGIRDDILNGPQIKDSLNKFYGFDVIYAPAAQHGNADHDLVNAIALDVFGDRVKQYTTYTKTELYTTGTIEVTPTNMEVAIKNKALDRYRSQIRINGPHFNAVRGKSEWFL